MAETKYVTVTMDDGRTVEFPETRRLIKTSAVNPDGSLTVRMDYVNGECRTFTLPPSLINQFALHGAEQKLGDAMAGIKDLEDAIEVVDQLILRLDKGEWTAESTGGSGMAGASILARALVEVTSQPITVVREYLGTLDNKTKAALRLTAEVAPVVAKLEAEKAARAAARGKKVAASVDTSSVLGNLRNLGTAGATVVESAGQPEDVPPMDQPADDAKGKGKKAKA